MSNCGGGELFGFLAVWIIGTSMGADPITGLIVLGVIMLSLYS
jgi:hypothetical protein